MKKVSLRYTSIAFLLFIFVPTQLITYGALDNMFSQQMEESKQNLRSHNDTAFDEFISLQFGELIMFAEKVVFLSDLESLSPENAVNYLEDVLPKLQSNYPIVGGYLIGSNKQKLLFGDKPSIDQETDYFSLAQKQTPVQDVYCDKECFLNISIPLNLEQEFWGLLFSVELTDSLIQFSQLRNTDLGLLMDTPATSLYTRSWQGRAVPILTNSEITQIVLDNINQPAAVLFNKGIMVEKSDSLYFVWGHEYAQSESAHFRVIFFEDYTSQKMAQNIRTYTVLGFMLFILTLLFILSIIVTSNPIRRLKNLSEAVTQIGRKHYADAAVTLNSTSNNSYFKDEIYTVQHALKSAAFSLEQYEAKLKESNEDLKHIASHDHVTGLLNRYALSRDMELLESQVGECRTLYLIDIKGFNEINDNLGHEVGDSLLEEIGRSLQKLAPESMDVYRYGGDEFMLVNRCENVFGHPEQLIEQILDQLQKVTENHQITLPLSFVCGISQGNTDDNDFYRLPLQADMALHEAKYHTGKSYEIYAAHIEARAIQQFQIRSYFEESLHKGDFYLTFQPLIDFSSKKLIKMEALVRWQHRDLGSVYPDKFIPILEETGQIEALTNWLVIQAAQTIKQLDKLGLDKVAISINISGVQVSDDTYIDSIMHMLAKNSVSPQRIELEITETSLVSDFDQARSWVEKAKKHGFKVAMDDFGTGYSSLSYLTSIPFDTIKLDRSLINDIVNNDVQQNVVTSVIRMVRDMGMKTVVEGIEETEQFLLLKSLKCNVAQGFLISRPLEKEALFKRLKTYQIENTWFKENDSLD